MVEINHISDTKINETIFYGTGFKEELTYMILQLSHIEYGMYGSVRGCCD